MVILLDSITYWIYIKLWKFRNILGNDNKNKRKS